MSRNRASLPRLLYLLLITTAPALGCSKPREVELRGVVVSVDLPKREVTIRHDDIPRFMPAMTMPFKVRDASLLEGRVPGDIVRGTLVVDDANTHLRALERTGSGAAPTPPATSPQVLAPGAQVPDARFLDDRADARQLSGWRGRALAVSFIYTRCPLPNFCPLIERHFQEVQAMILKDANLRGRVRLLSVSFDPIHDQPAVLAARAKQLQADPTVWLYLTGEREEIERFAAGFGVSILPPTGDTQEIVHSLRTAVIDSHGRLTHILGGTEWTPQELMADLRKAVDGH